jgi:hypothetical protein
VKNSKNVDFNPTTSIINLNVKSPNKLVKRQILLGLVKKQDSTIYSLQQIHIEDTDRLKMKGQKEHATLIKMDLGNEF